MSYKLLKTQLLPPVEAHALLPRQRLVDQAQQLTHQKLAFIQAAAGFGKTSLMCQWYQFLKQRSLAVAWLSIDSSGLSPIDLLAYIGAALASTLPALSKPVNAAVESRRYLTTDALITTLVNLLAESPAPIILFIDDLHYLPDESCVQLARLIKLSPRALHFVLASRTQTDLGLAAIRAQGQLQEIGMEDLRFTPEETKAYIEDAGWSDADLDAIKLLEKRTDGWITGIKLASLAYRASDFNYQTLLRYSGSHHDVSDFFAEQVLSTQEQEVKSFLLKTSLLDRFSADLCDHALQTHKSRGILDRIENSGLFLIGIDRERQWYRYHPLFRDFLARQLKDSTFQNQNALMQRAAAWFSERGMLAEAIDILLKVGETEKAAEILENCSQDWTYKGRITLIMQYIQRIPRDVLDRYPTILLTWVWHLIRHLNFEDSRLLLDHVHLLIDTAQQQGQLSPANYDELRHQLLHREMTLAAAQDNTPLVEEKCQELLSFSEGNLHPYLRGSVYSQLLYAQREQFKMHDLEALAAKARGVLDRSGYDFALIAVLSVIGTSFYAIGKADAAQQAIAEGIAVATHYSGEKSELVALAELPLSAILYESNDIQRAEEILTRQLANATDWGLVDQFIAGYVTRIRISTLHGNEEEAQQVLDEGMALALDRNLERLRLALVAEQLRILTMGQSVSQQRINQYGRSAGIPESNQTVMASSNSRSEDEYRAIAWFRIAIANDDLIEAQHLAKSWRRFSDLRGAKQSHVRWSIFLAQALFQSGDPRLAQRILRDAIAIAAPMGMCRSFVDEGPAIATLVENCCQAKAGSSHPTDIYAMTLLEAFGGKLSDDVDTQEDDVIYSQLGDREIEVLLQVSLGMRNREVAERLGMTEGSIKWYMQQIFDKLGTRSRFQAVERARKLGLIN